MQNSELRLTELSHCAGWAAKLSLEDLVEILKNVPVLHHPNLLVGTETGDDAAVYKINDETALILTVDFFPPITDDPFEYGEIAAKAIFSIGTTLDKSPLSIRMASAWLHISFKFNKLSWFSIFATIIRLLFE